MFCNGKDSDKLSAGIILIDIFKANITPLTQDVSFKPLIALVLRFNTIFRTR